MLSALAVDTIEQTAESGRWHARDVSYYSGPWDQLRVLLPTFELADFRAGPEAPRNPYMRSVVRIPRAADEQPVPVGVVSNTYTLVQHQEVAGRCFDGIRRAGIDVTALRCELGLTPLGEWMNLRVYFPEAYRYRAHREVGDVMDLRLECFNSVDGTSRLVVTFGWLRLICLNGMVIGETVVERRDVHNRHLSPNQPRALPLMPRQSPWLVSQYLFGALRAPRTAMRFLRNGCKIPARSRIAVQFPKSSKRG